MSELSILASDLPFIEYSLVLPEEMYLINSVPDAHVDEKRLSKLLNSALKLPLWVDFSEIATDTVNYPGQLDLLGHSNEPVLLIKSGNDESVYLFKFKKHETHEDMFYGRDQKYLIEKCLILMLSSFVKQEPEEKESFEKYFQICKNQLLKISHLNDELTRRNFETEKFFTSLFNYFLKEEILPGCKISLSDSTLNYLQTADLEFSEIEQMAKEAYKTAVELSPSSTDIRIRRYFLPEQSPNKLNIPVLTGNNPEIFKPLSDLKPEKGPEVKSKTKTGITKLEKTLLLLDRYEMAVKKLIEQKLPVMGKNIAKMCIPEISAPALTDSINKHSGRIRQCLETYPDKWPLLRNNYQPVQKLNF